MLFAWRGNWQPPTDDWFGSLACLLIACWNILLSVGLCLLRRIFQQPMMIEGCFYFLNTFFAANESVCSSGYSQMNEVVLTSATVRLYVLIGWKCFFYSRKFNAQYLMKYAHIKRTRPVIPHSIKHIGTLDALAAFTQFTQYSIYHPHMHSYTYINTDSLTSNSVINCSINK